VVGEFTNGKTIWKTLVQVGGWHIKFVFDTFCVKMWTGLHLFRMGPVANFCECSSEFSGSVKLGDLSVSCVTTNSKLLLTLLQIRLCDIFRFKTNFSE